MIALLWICSGTLVAGLLLFAIALAKAGQGN
jgi:hypothetical protein